MEPCACIYSSTFEYFLSPWVLPVSCGPFYIYSVMHSSGHFHPHVVRLVYMTSALAIR